MSPSVLNSSLCHLSTFHLVLCPCFSSPCHLSEFYPNSWGLTIDHHLGGILPGTLNRICNTGNSDILYYCFLSSM